MLWRKNDHLLKELERELREREVLNADEDDEAEEEVTIELVNRYFHLAYEGTDGPDYLKPGDFYNRLFKARPSFEHWAEVEQPGDSFWRKPESIYQSYYI